MALITLVVTNNCNLNCSYCYETHNKNTMTSEIAKSIIDKEFEQADRNGVLELDFFGGEPFLNFQLIKELYSYIENEAKKYKQKFHCFATTNGTLIHGDIQNWLLEKKENFSLGLSLDGNKHMHNINRSNSFDLIDLEFFRDNYINQPVKMTISKETLPYLYDGVKFIHDLGFEVNCNLAFGIDWSDENNAKILEKQLMKLINFYLCNPSVKPCLLLERSILPVAFKDSKFIERNCGAGINMRTYDVDGKCYPCQFFMPISVGVERAKTLGNINFLDKVSISLLNDECQKCCAKSVCDSCYGSNYKEQNDIYKQTMTMCRLNKILIKARSYFKAKQYLNGQIKLGEKEKQALLRSIKIIQEELR